MSRLIEGMILRHNGDTPFYYKIVKILSNDKVQYKGSDNLINIDAGYTSTADQDEFTSRIVDGHITIVEQKVDWKRRLE